MLADEVLSPSGIHPRDMDRALPFDEYEPAKKNKARLLRRF
jgi:hypothetical protein